MHRLGHDEGHRLVGEHAGLRCHLAVRICPAGQVNGQHVCRVTHLAQQVIDLRRQARASADADDPIDDQLGLPQRRRDHRRRIRMDTNGIEHRSAGVAGCAKTTFMCRLRDLEHHNSRTVLREQGRGIQRISPVVAGADHRDDRTAIFDGGFDHDAEIVVVLLADIHVAGIDAILRQRPRHIGILLEQEVAVIVEVADHRHAHAELVEGLDDLGTAAAAASVLTVTRNCARAGHSAPSPDSRSTARPRYRYWSSTGPPPGGLRRR